MNNLKYLIAGIIVGGGLGAKTGEYIAALAEAGNTFQWIESAMVIGALSGLVIALAILAAVSTKTNEVEYPAYSSEEKRQVGRMQTS